MNIEKLTRQIEQGSIEKFALAKSPDSGAFWFVYSLHRETQQSEKFNGREVDHSPLIPWPPGPSTHGQHPASPGLSFRQQGDARTARGAQKCPEPCTRYTHKTP